MKWHNKLHKYVLPFSFYYVKWISLNICDCILFVYFFFVFVLFSLICEKLFLFFKAEKLVN